MAALDPTVTSVLAEGRQLHVGVLTTTGPHVTPELYAAVGDDIWFATAATTLKTRVIRRDPTIAGLVQVGSRALLVLGRAEDFDIADPMRLVGQARHAVQALQGVGAFTLRNAADLGGFARDLVRGRLPSRRPPRRVLVRLRPTAWALVDGGRLDVAEGNWPGDMAAAHDQDASAVPGVRDVAVGWETPAGVTVLAGRADNGLDSVRVPGAAARLAGISAGDTARACVVADDYNAPGPAAKAGALLRGHATAHDEGALTRLDLVVERETTWDGAEAHTSDAVTTP